MVRLSDICSENSCLNEKKAAVIGLEDCAGSAAVVGWIPRLLLRLVVRTQTSRSVAWFCGEDSYPMPLGEITDFSPLRYLSLPPT